MGDPDETLAVVVARLGDLREDFGKLRAELADRDKQYVTRAEFEMWREAHTGQMAEARRGRDELQKQIDRRHVPWTSVIAAVVAVVALAWTVVQAVAA